jgi:hypothetical protein
MFSVRGTSTAHVVKPIEAVYERKAGTLKMPSGKCPSVTGSITLHFSISATKISIELRTADGAHELS